MEWKSIEKDGYPTTSFTCLMLFSQHGEMVSGYTTEVNGEIVFQWDNPHVRKPFFFLKPKYYLELEYPKETDDV